MLVDQSAHQYDGCWYDELHGILVKWPPGWLSGHVLGAMECTKEEGILHGVISPQVAEHLRQSVPFDEFNKLPKITNIL